MLGFLFSKVPQVKVDEVKKAMDDKGDFILLDVRTPQEYAKGHLDGSVNFPLDEVDKVIETKFPDKKKRIYVYCLSGSRSVQAVDSMVKLGYSNVYDMKNGLLAWRVNKYPVVV